MRIVYIFESYKKRRERVREGEKEVIDRSWSLVVSGPVGLLFELRVRDSG